MFSLTQEAAIKLLIDARILDEVEGKHEHKAGVVRFTRVVNCKTNSSGIKFVWLRIPKSILIRLYDKRRELLNQSYISALYSIGIGVPKDEKCAQFWRKQSSGECKCHAYAEYSALFKEHLKSVISNSFFVYQNTVEKQVSLLNTVKTKCAVVYKGAASGYVIHNIINEGVILIDSVSPGRIGLDTVLDLPLIDNAKYIVQLGNFEESNDYNINIDIHDMTAAIDESPCIKEKILNEFSKGIYFAHKNTIMIDNQWQIKQMKIKQ